MAQGIRIAVNLYENDSFDPTPLNTVWFGNFLLDDATTGFSGEERRRMLISISDYLIEELGYRDYNERGVYFYYGPTLKKEVYNASALISSFLLRVGSMFSIEKYKTLGELGITYILHKQNGDGSWFYSELNKAIDNFHQSYILQALYQAQGYIRFSLKKNIEKGLDYYKNNLFGYTERYVIPIRYDKRYNPKNTWLLQKVDGRDITDALLLFSQYSYNKRMLDGLINYTYDYFYGKKNGCFAGEILLYGKNKIPYLEFQAWFLFALETVLQCS